MTESHARVVELAYERGYVICIGCGCRIPIANARILKYPHGVDKYLCKQSGWCGSAKGEVK